MATVNRRILIKKDGVMYKVGNVFIKVETGDIYYVPSQKGVIGASTTDMVKKTIDHVSWHKSGTVHIKDKSQKRVLVEKGIYDGVNGIRQKIQDIGYQRILLDTITNINTLPVHNKKITEMDVILEISKYSGPVQFDFSVVSGRQIVNSLLGKKTPVHEVDKKIQAERILDIQRGALGHESGNSDRVLLDFGVADPSCHSTHFVVVDFD